MPNQAKADVAGMNYNDHDELDGRQVDHSTE